MGWKQRPAGRALVKRVYDRAGGKCEYCWQPLDEAGPWHIDHFVPIVSGGRREEGNLRLACVRCNSMKGGRTPAEWRAQMIASVRERLIDAETVLAKISTVDPRITMSHEYRAVLKALDATRTRVSALKIVFGFERGEP